ncbi:hypothetical protein V6N13_020018 [Hibiscus sabdariffa]
MPTSTGPTIALSLSLSPPHLCPKIMSMIGENSDDLMRMSSSDESPKEPEEVMKAPTNAKNKRKGKKTVEAISERVFLNYGILIKMRLEKHLLEWWLLMSCHLVLWNVKDFVILQDCIS